jgi:hypothetical protein
LYEHSTKAECFVKKKELFCPCNTIVITVSIERRYWQKKVTFMEEEARKEMRCNGSHGSGNTMSRNATAV